MPLDLYTCTVSSVDIADQMPLNLLRCLSDVNCLCYIHCYFSEAEEMYLRATGAIAARFRGPQVTCMVEAPNEPLTEAPHPVILRGGKLDSDHINAGLSSETAEEDDVRTVSRSDLCSKNKDTSSFTSMEEIRSKLASYLIDQSSPKSAAPIAEYFRALKEAKLLVEDYNLQVTHSLLCR
ncbi:hypothetical protein Vadar_025140 [Vaccinium darrowii]|uniref:Uncharacterized protein n=1 Tax=Vaccinium darrowii TaxID=229202 RepID=A0ACB7YYF8_9ERIC|nr:hypothetical protein Vadar_025140 [Vaccinium darrowii]